MKTSKLSDWLGVITNIGVITGLILIAYEIHQNNIALEQEARISRIEVVDGIRGAWQNWEYVIIENRDVADIWMRGNAGEPLDPLEEFRFDLLAREMYRLISQNYRQYSTIDGEPADGVVQQLIEATQRSPRAKKVIMQQLERQLFSQDSLRNRVNELNPPELRTQNAED